MSVEPSEKSPEMENTLDNLSQDVFGRKRTDSIKSGICVVCGTPAHTFRDALSEKEYRISGMCQSCQDNVF